MKLLLFGLSLFSFAIAVIFLHRPPVIILFDSRNISSLMAQFLSYICFMTVRHKTRRTFQKDYVGYDYQCLLRLVKAMVL